MDVEYKERRVVFALRDLIWNTIGKGAKATWEGSCKSEMKCEMISFLY